MYGDDTYREKDIRDFVRSQHNLEESDHLTDPALREQVGKMDLLFRFTEKQTPALGFQHTTEDLYILIYLDPSMATRWAEEWELPAVSTQPRPASFIDMAHLDEVNASVDAMRASLFGTPEPETAAKFSAVSLLYRVAHAGHEVTAYEATQLYDLAKTLEAFLGALAPIGRHHHKR